MYVQAASIKIGMAETAPVLDAFVHGIAASNTDSLKRSNSFSQAETEATAHYKQQSMAYTLHICCSGSHDRM